MRAIFVGQFTGVVPVRVLSRYYCHELGVWYYNCRITGRKNPYYTYGQVYSFRLSELCLKVRYSNRGNTIIKSGAINPEQVKISEEIGIPTL